MTTTHGPLAIKQPQRISDQPPYLIVGVPAFLYIQVTDNHQTFLFDQKEPQELTKSWTSETVIFRLFFTSITIYLTVEVGKYNHAPNSCQTFNSSKQIIIELIKYINLNLCSFVTA